MSESESVFAAARDAAYPFVYHGTIEVGTLVGGVPSDPNVARGWLETKLKGTSTEEQIQKMVSEVMVERKIPFDQALDEVNKMKNLNGFKRGTEKDSMGLPSGHDGVLYYEGRQLKAALKEAVSVAVAADKIKQQGWGTTRKWISGFFPEHVFILENKLYLRDTNDVLLTEPTNILQQFVHTRFGSSIQYQEFVNDARFDFTVVTDYLFSDADWAHIWTTGEMNGLGASRSQGYGTYKVIKWEKDFTPAGTAWVRKHEKVTEELDASGPVVRTRSRSKAA